MAGAEYQPGDVVPDSALATLPANRLDAMKRTRYLVEKVTAVAEPGEEAFISVEMGPEPVVEGICPQCGEGPFSRLARHITAKHESIEELESVNGN